MEQKKKSNFTGSLGFVLAAAGSAVGVGNIWRFPYLAAKDGGGLFLLVYLILVLTFGFALLTTDIAIGRKTGKHAWHAFGALNKKWGFLGKLTFVVPAIIMTYYGVIGGWILKYATVYVTGAHHEAAKDNYFTDFITSPVAPIVFMLIFLAFTAVIVYFGVEKGIEKFSKFVMPGLFIMVIGIAIYSLTLRKTVGEETRTGLQGLAIYLIPDFEGLTFSKFLNILLDAMSQLFFSLSVSMGIMITYGSYVKKDVNLNKSIAQIEFFDTGVAFLAGIMIIPAIYVFSGLDGMKSGPSLMFVSLPKVFESMGVAGIVIGIVFFVMLIFAALTSCISIMETLVATCMDVFHSGRKKTTLIIAAIAIICSVVICLGYNALYFEVDLPNGAQDQQLLDIVDYISNSFLMPLISFLTAIFIGWVVKPKAIGDEMIIGAKKFSRRRLYSFMVKFVVPVIMAVLFFQSTGLLNFIFK